MLSIKAKNFILDAVLVKNKEDMISESNNPIINHTNAKNAIPISYTASQLRQAYNYQSITNNPTVKKVKIAIIIAYTYSGLLSDLNTYWKYCFGPSAVPPKVTVHTMPGATFNSGWAQEECLDVQMVCAMAPNADIYVVEAKSNSFINMMTAINYASNTIKADVLSMSWGYDDRPNNGQSTLYSYFTNSKICYVASSGDAVTPSFPSTHVNILSIGGTTLNNISPARSETTWTLGGSGYSSQIAKPIYQNNISNITKGKRCIPDVALVANPNSGVFICYKGQGYIIGGTSVSAPLFAGILGNVIQNRLNKNKKAILTTVINTLNSSTSLNLQTELYKSIYKNNSTNIQYKLCFNDILNGTDGPNVATVGYDLCTGLGSPNSINLCNLLSLL